MLKRQVFLLSNRLRYSRERALQRYFLIFSRPRFRSIHAIDKAPYPRPTSDRDEPALPPVLVAAMWPTIVTCTLLVPYLDVLDFAVFFCACEVLVAFCIFQRAPVLSCTCSFSSLSFFRVVTRRSLRCSVHHFAASSSALPPISPIMMMLSVSSSSRNRSSTSMKLVPLTGSPPIPTAVVWPRPTMVVW